MTFKYPALPASGKHIRILTVHPGDDEDIIRCTLEVADLEKARFYALSYTWGDESDKVEIEVNGEEFGVTQNLEIALLHLRKPDSDIVLWADAICIDQMDDLEKSHQVALMGEIYKRTAAVGIWLGSDGSPRTLGSGPTKEPTRHDPFALLRGFMKEDRHIHEIAGFNKIGIDEKGEFLWQGSEWEEDEEFRNFWESFLKVAHSKWWTRMWTVQEAILPETGLLAYDDYTMGLLDVMKIGQSLVRHGTCCAAAFACVPADMQQSLIDLFGKISDLNFDRERTTTSKALMRYFDLQYQYTTYSTRQCRDPRDKIYGLLHISEDIFVEPGHQLVPDYSTPVAQVYYDATRGMLLGLDGDLKCLSGISPTLKRSKYASWVYDFAVLVPERDARKATNWALHYRYFNASGGRWRAPVIC
ncbi:heterokaryon incompatibility protein-domain-containing protein [Paraphoma chrysanthemicola]|uniref:Heterokaryon incompatibility protein-domain-containing protein n=1 Tax=Paraphoma chrysanthemicola TaxID=798071 RepID=A0A8K0QVE8_9PLEO|nr:heterokaryon incompatibility protein-domain-containing protein [Paraphoma chrysanthemicola]